MANLTQTQIRQYVRALVNENDFAELKDTLMNQMINHAIRKVQQDLINLGMKVFIKQAKSEGYIASVPTDLLNLPNAIIDIKASTGTKATYTATFDSGQTITVTVNEPGTGGDGWTITITDNNSTTGALTNIDLSAKTATIGIDSGTTTIANLTTLFSTNVILLSLFTFSASGTGTITESVLPANMSVGSAGSGTGWLTAEEVSIEKFNRDSTNTYLAPTTTNIVYKRNGDQSSTQIIEFLPNTIKYSYIYYYYRLADLTADSDVSPIPSEYEELLIIDVAVKCYSRLRSMEGVQEKMVEYDRKIQALQGDYTNLLNTRQVDKIRIKSEDKN